MLRFVLRKMISKKWMVLALLIGNILLVGITCANAMYADAMLQRTLTRNLADYMAQENAYPGTICVEAGSTAGRNPLVTAAANAVRNLPGNFGVDAAQLVEHYFVGPMPMKTSLHDEDDTGTLITLGTLTQMEQHVQVVGGRMFAPKPDENGVMDIMVSERGMVEMGLTLDEIVTMPLITDRDGQPLQLRVCGVFRNNNDADLYWVRSPSSFRTECLMAETAFTELFITNGTEHKLSGQFYALLDYTAMQPDQVEYILETSAYYKEYFEENPGMRYSEDFSNILSEFATESKKVEVTLWVLQVPIFVLLAAFIFMVSGQMLQRERDEIAMLKSRGASKKQIVSTYLVQSGVLAVAGLGIGIPFGVFLVQVLGSANAFLEFVQRSALPVKIDGKVLLFGAASAFLSVAAMVLPVFRHADTTIVDRKQKKHRKNDAPLWQRLFLDVVVLAVALYALYSFNNQKDALAQRVLDGESLDPLLFISSSLFMIGAGLLALRILPAITYLIFRIFKKKWNPALYAGFLQVIRTRHSQNFIVVFLILTIALGVFNAQTAGTINANEEANLRYGIGADVVLQEKWEDNSAQVENDPELELIYEEPDFQKYADIAGVRSAAKVLRITDGSMRVPRGTIKNLQVMGIHTKSFGETAWFKDGLLEHHFFDYLNAMATNPGAVLLSQNFADDYGYELGDSVSFENAQGESARGIVYGFVKYWPGYSSASYSKSADGRYRQTDHYLIVANLSQLQADWGITPYEVWLDVEDSSQVVYDFAREQGLAFEKFEDTSARIVAAKNDPIFQGTNGILTVGFIVVLLICSVGFLIYWILSIKSRTLQFGIYRAMGMSIGEIIAMLLCEQVFISGTAVATGTLVGFLTAKLYMPLIQMAYAAYDSALPLEVVNSYGDIAQMLIVVGIVILVCMLILAGLISKMKITQALKLGED
ncbi:MAG: ABC transporter permease [Oscillospiraceae bacterium]|nr:ABC transporter permease [Oscillospiraceae bacterium]